MKIFCFYPVLFKHCVMKKGISAVKLHCFIYQQLLRDVISQRSLCFSCCSELIRPTKHSSEIVLVCASPSCLQRASEPTGCPFGSFHQGYLIMAVTLRQKGALQSLIRLIHLAGMRTQKREERKV